MNYRRSVPSLLLAAVVLLMGSVAPVAAGADGADYVVWRFPASGPRGLGFIRDGASDATLIAETVGLRANSAHRLVGSTALCGDGHQPGNAVWTKSFQSNGKGAAFLSATIGDQALSSAIRSIRLFRGSGQVDCAKPIRFQSNAAGGMSHGAFVTFTAYGARLAVFVDMRSGVKRLTAAGHGFIATHGYRLIASSGACPSQPTTATTLYERSGSTNSLGVLWRHDSASFGDAEPRSIQLFNHQSNRVACATPTRLPSAQ